MAGLRYAKTQLEKDLEKEELEIMRDIQRFEIMDKLQKYVNLYGLGISKERLIDKAYWQFELSGHNCCVVNDRYLKIDGNEFQLIKSKSQGRWVVKEI